MENRPENITRGNRGYHKQVALVLFIVIALSIVLIVASLISASVGVNTHGAEMTDSYGFIITIVLLLYESVFAAVCFRIIKLKEPRPNTWFRLGLTFLLGIVLPLAFFIFER